MGWDVPGNKDLLTAWMFSLLTAFLQRWCSCCLGCAPAAGRRLLVQRPAWDMWLGWQLAHGSQPERCRLLPNPLPKRSAVPQLTQRS